MSIWAVGLLGKPFLAFALTENSTSSTGFVDDKPNASGPTFKSSRARNSAEQHFSTSVKRLHNAIPISVNSRLVNCSFPDFSCIDTVDAKGEELERGIDALIEALDTETVNRDRTQVINDVVQGYFRASYPFAKLFFIIIKNDNSVSNPIKRF